MSQSNPALPDDASPDPQIDPYNRLPDESVKAFEGYVIYRDMGRNRSVAAVAKQLGRSSIRYLQKWSQRYNWPERVDAFDRAIETEQLRIKLAQEREAYIKKLRIYNMHHEAIGSAGLAFVSNYLLVGNSLLAPLVKKVNDKQELSAREQDQFFQLRRLRDVFPIADTASSFMGEALHIRRLVEQLEAAEHNAG
jgi:hypothetical protein